MIPVEVVPALVGGDTCFASFSNDFDCVVIPDLTPAFYPAVPELAHSLYVAATRARHWLWLLTPEIWSPLVSSATMPA